MSNDEIKNAIRTARLFNYEVAGAIGISEYTLCRWFRTELPEDRKRMIMDAISVLRGSRQNG